MLIRVLQTQGQGELRRVDWIARLLSLPKKIIIMDL